MVIDNLKIKVFNDEDFVFEGTVKQLVELNEYDTETIDMCERLRENNVVNYNHLHSGHWRVEKI